MPEERLQYGFRRLPHEQPHRKHFPQIAEERLQAVDRPVVELRPVRADSQSAEDEFEEEEFAEEEAEARQSSLGHLGYADIGYHPAHAHEPRFEQKQCPHSAPSVHQPCHDPQPLPAVGSCGFERGAVVVENGQHSNGHQQQQQSSHSTHQQQHHHQQQQQHVYEIDDNGQSQVIDIDLDQQDDEQQYGSVAYDRFRRESSSSNSSTAKPELTR